MSFFVYIVFFLVGRTLFYVLILGLILFSFFLPSDSVINPTSLNHLIKVFFFYVYNTVVAFKLTLMENSCTEIICFSSNVQICKGLQ